MYSDLKYLAVPLPEDIERMKCRGDFEMAQRAIDRRLQGGLPFALKKRLELECEILPRYQKQYPYPRREALALLRENLSDFRDEELDVLLENGLVEWIYVNGEIRFHRLFLDNLLKTQPAFAVRNLFPKNQDGRNSYYALLDGSIAEMKAKGSLAYYFRIRSTLTIRDDGRMGREVTVHLPIPVEYAQVRNFRLLSTSMEPAAVAPPDYPQRTVCFKTTLRERQAFSVEYEFESHLRYMRPKPERVLDAQPTFYTEELAPHIHFTPFLRSLACEIVGQEKNPLLKAEKIYDYITSHIVYSFVRSYSAIPDITSFAAAGLKGDCGIQALLFITLCRIAGIPARWQAGLTAVPGDVGCHDWAQFYVAPYGWLFADCSYGGTAYRHGAAERREFYFGNIDPFRIPTASEFQHEFYLPTNRLRSDPYDNQSGEAVFADRCLTGDEFDTKHEALEIHPVH